MCIFIRQTAPTTNKSESKTNANEQVNGEFNNKQPVDSSWS